MKNNTRFVQATQENMAGTGIGAFNDRIRDAIRGGGLMDRGIDHVKNQRFINGLFYDPNSGNTGSKGEMDKLQLSADQIRVGLAGNLANFCFVDRNGKAVTGAEVDYHGSPTGYTSDLREVINYAAASLRDSIPASAGNRVPRIPHW